MEYTKQNEFGQDIIKYQYINGEDLYVMTFDITYKLWKITNGKKKKIGENRQGSIIWGMIPSYK